MQTFEKIKQFITFNKKVRGKDGQSVTISINIPEMMDDQLISEVKYICRTMQSCLGIMDGRTKKINSALAAASGHNSQISTEEAARQFEKGFGILVKLNNEIIIRGLSKDVEDIVQKTLGRDSSIDPGTDKDMLMLE